MPARQPNAGGPVYQLKVTLRDSKPPIWRRVLVGGETTLHRLHWIIQAAMGWTNSHLHQFIIDGEYYSQPEFELGDAGLDVKNEKRVKLQNLGLGPKGRIIYEYDFGDSWEHEILIEKVTEPEAGARYPQCVAGKRACPPEDCGGVWGYADFIEAIKDPNHPEHESMLEWAGGDFDPEGIDLEEINEELGAIR